MSCDSIRSQFFLLLYGELTFDQEELVEQHLQSCADCRAELERQKNLGAALAAHALDAPAGLLSRCRGDLRLKIASAARAREAKPGFAARSRQALRLLLGPSDGFLQLRFLFAARRRGGTPARGVLRRAHHSAAHCPGSL